MIDLVNTSYMTQDQRRASLQRAIHSQPFFNLLSFNLVASINKTSQYGAKAQVDKDFWLTEIKANYGEVLADTTAMFLLSLYIASKGDSIFKYISGESLPTAFQTADIRDTLTVANQAAFCDLQRELMPTLIKRGDSLLARTQNLSPKTDPAEIHLVVSGYYALEQAYIAGRTQQGVNESLEDDIRFEKWKFDVDYTGQKDHVLNNDRTARMVLGFGITLKDDEADGTIPTGTAQIFDPYRGIKFNNDPFNIAFFAPKVNQVRDAVVYYLPVEYFWQPFAPMRFSIVNALNGGHGYEWTMLTRTV